MARKTAVVIKGDGTGPELVEAVLDVLKSCNSQVEFVTCDAGSEWWMRAGGHSYISDEVWDLLKESSACFKGPTTTVPNPDAPRSVAVSIRQRFELYANVRPIKTYRKSERTLDFLCVREATEGLYAGIEFRTSDDSAIAIRKTTRKGCERVALKAFELARERNYRKLIVVTKRNILKETDGIFWNAVKTIGLQFQDIEIEEYYVDNMTQQLVKNPERFNQNILLSTNLFMDIVSECASGHVGSIGNVYSGNFGDAFAMFEPAHGSAPKYSGMDKVNPVASILSGAWMVGYLGETEIFDAILQATGKIIADGKYVTYDLGGESSLTRMAAEISHRSSSLLRK
ncbi:MAG TPA: isocitrate/isopropylmalate family dehydrogenase [Nitrososphaeraceae archaeon]|nr:isocitrate/isopropylmalate family dehydrogenase [Nitrososphaeraceae archaeon]